MDPESPKQVEWSADLVDRVRSGDRSALSELYHRYHDDLLFAVRCRLGTNLRHHLDSEDVLQSVMLEALGELDGLDDRGAGSLRHFLHVLIANKIRDRADTFGAQKRRGTVMMSECIADDLATPSSELRYIDDERYERLERCLGLLVESDRHIIILRKIDGLSSRECAEQLGLSAELVRKSYSRAMARLSALVAEDVS